ncbi:ABC transporter ATP-binding protein [Ruania halotolerans]|uniref:ABC transporter ATP-binding protein n=1 Tax=Ruania halotolerans TaxID=2897773 RepID=UPI001E656990|nr:ABC transporter ATP-binding protein [Ruania halotolerans]UFU07698.1 ABC transporter ATP-binding protein [Ruania halotolerans]
MSALRIRDLRIAFGRRGRTTEVVSGISLNLEPGRVQGLAGESGSGKTVSGLAVLGLLPDTAHISGSIQLNGTELVGMSERELNRVRGAQVAMVFQDPSASLHPQLTVGSQLTDHMRTHMQVTKRQARERAVELLDRVQVPEPEGALRRYPHQFSGGQRQRIAIALALACDPQVLLADEPTTALDVTVQAGILHLLRDLAAERDLAVLLVTHDLGVMSAIADDVAVMRHGRIVEAGARSQVFTAPTHPYTRELLASMPEAHESLIEEAP